MGCPTFGRKRSIYRKACPLLPTVLLSLLLFGCTSYTGGFTASPTSITFGEVAVGSIIHRTLNLTNSGTVPITITRAAASGKGFSVKGPSLPFTMTEGQSATFTTKFAPTAMGDASGILLITKSEMISPQLTGGNGPAPPSVLTKVESIAMTGSGVESRPSITTQPVNQTVKIGQTAKFSVAASGEAPLSYQWLKNGTPISGATSPGYNTPATSASDSGSRFSAVVSNAEGNVTSNVAVLTMDVAGQLATSTTKLSYGTITVGSSSVLPVTLTNTGGSSISISSVTISGTGLSIGGISSGQILPNGISALLDVTFARSGSGVLNGSVSIRSNAANSTVTIPLSGTAVQPVTHSVTLNLTPNSSNCTGYNIYRSSISTGPYMKLNSPLVISTTYTDTDVQADQTYYYVGTSVDSTGVETAYSNQVSATIPTN